jgi:hypothetical protein
MFMHNPNLIEDKESNSINSHKQDETALWLSAF